MSNSINNQNPSAIELLKEAVLSYADIRDIEARASIFFEQNEISSKQFKKYARDASVMRFEIGGLIDFLASRKPLSDEEVNKALSIAPNCLRFTPMNTQK